MNIKVENCNSPDDLLSKLDPANTNWSGWFFRGQEDEKHELIPSVWRDTMAYHFKQFSDRVGTVNAQNALKNHVNTKGYKVKGKEFENMIACQIYRIYEIYLLYQFYKTANIAGLDVPKRALQLIKTYPLSFWEKDQVVAGLMMAVDGYYDSTSNVRYILGPHLDDTLPQHYGLPTRVLDWSSNPRIALFFAIYACKNYSDKDSFSVYAIRPCINNGNSSDNPIFFDTIHDRRKNKFLHHQNGVFSRVYGEMFYFENGQWPSINDLYKKYGNKYFDLIKFTPPFQQ